MLWQKVIKWAQSDYLKLVLILGLAFYLAFIPHQSYPYPVHVDEWTHLSCANEIIKEGKAFNLTDPFQGGVPIYHQLVEDGFHTFWAVFHLTSDIDWFTIFKYFPGGIFMLIVLSVYILANRHGFGWQAALFTCLIPTSIGSLGPTLLVPVAMGLFFIIVSLFIAFYFKNWQCYILLFLFSLFLFAMHAVTAIALILILIPYIIISLKNSFKHSMGIILALVAPFFLSLLIFAGIRNILVIPTLKSLFIQQSLPTHIDMPQVISTFGYLPVLVCLLGAALLIKKRGKINYSLVGGLVVILVLFALYQNYGYGIWMLYTRSFLYVCLLMSIVAGAGLMGIQDFKLPAFFPHWKKSPLIINNIGRVLCVVVIGVMLYFAIPARQQTYYYHMIDDTDYKSFVWIRDNLGNDYKEAILDPWIGVPFTAITGKNVYAYIITRPEQDDRNAYAFLSSGCKDTNFLKENNISIVYTREACDNPDLVAVSKYVYVVKENQFSEK